jgi:tRNA U34 5-carboxymethylaminomethyl modifying GTPase MnmE/TrmE
MRAGITAAANALAAAVAAVAAGRNGAAAADEAVVAGLLHEAIDALGEVTGAVVGTDLLDRIFSRHCIGK